MVFIKTVEEFENIVVRSNPDGSAIRLKDVSKVELAAEDYQFLGRSNLVPDAIIQVTQLSDANAIDVVKGCNKKMKELSKKFPHGIKYEVQRDGNKIHLTQIILWA